MNFLYKDKSIFKFFECNLGSGETAVIDLYLAQYNGFYLKGAGKSDNIYLYANNEEYVFFDDTGDIFNAFMPSFRINSEPFSNFELKVERRGRGLKHYSLYVLTEGKILGIND